MFSLDILVANRRAVRPMFAALRSRHRDPPERARLEVRGESPAAVLVSMLSKLAKRPDPASRLLDNDAHDVYRLLVATPTDALAAGLEGLSVDGSAGETKKAALEQLQRLFAAGPEDARLADGGPGGGGDRPTRRRGGVRRNPRRRPRCSHGDCFPLGLIDRYGRRAIVGLLAAGGCSLSDVEPSALLG